MDPTAPLPPAFFDDAFVEAEAAEVLDRAAEAVNRDCIDEDTGGRAASGTRR